MNSRFSPTKNSCTIPANYSETVKQNGHGFLRPQEASSVHATPHAIFHSANSLATKTRPPLPRTNGPPPAAGSHLQAGALPSANLFRVDASNAIKPLGQSMAMKFTPRRMTPVVVNTTPVELSDEAIRMKVTKFVDDLHEVNGLPPASFYPRKTHVLEEDLDPSSKAFLEEKRKELDSIFNQLDQLPMIISSPEVSTPSVGAGR